MGRMQMIVDAKTKSYSLKIDVSEALPTGMVETKLVFQRPGEPDEIVIEKVSPVSAVKQMMDGIFRELYIATKTKTS
jgi:hypothetical protein